MRYEFSVDFAVEIDVSPLDDAGGLGGEREPGEMGK